MSKFAKTMTAIGAVVMALLVCLAASLMMPAANAADPEPEISTQMSQDGASSIKGGALVGWNGWEYTPEGATVPVKVNFVENEDGSGMWYSLTDEGIEGKTSGVVSKEEVGKSLVKVEDGASSLVDNVSYKNLNTSQEYTLIGNLAAKFADGSYGIVLSVNRKPAADDKKQDTGNDADVPGDRNGAGTTDETDGNTNTGGNENTDENANTGSNTNENTPSGNTNTNTNTNENGNAGDDTNENGNANDNTNNNNNENENTNGNENESEDSKPKIADLGTITYYNPVDKKVYTRPIADGKSEPVEVEGVKVKLDVESGMPLEAVTAAVKFVPSSSSASVKNVFRGFDATDMWGWTFVAFERLYAGDLVSDSDANENTNGNDNSGNSNENSNENAGTKDDEGNTTKMVVNGTLADVLVALDGASANVTAYSFPVPLSADTTPTETEALAAWQASVNGGLQGTKTDALQHELVVYTDPAYAAGGDKADTIPSDQNAMYVQANDSSIANAKTGDVIIWTNADGSHPVDAYVKSIATSTDIVDGVSTSYNTYTLVLFPVPDEDGSGNVKYSTGDSDVVVSYSGNAAGYHIGNYGYTEINGHEFAFKLTGIHVSGADWTYTYQLYDFEKGTYTTATENTPYTNVIGNTYCDDASRPDWTTSADVTRHTLAYDENMTNPAPPAPPAETVSISFDANGGIAVASMTGTAGEPIENQVIGTTTKDGFTFGGWWTKDGSDGDWGSIAAAENEDGTYNVMLAIYPDADVTYYAKWNANSPTTPDPDDGNENKNDNANGDSNSNGNDNENSNGNENGDSNEPDEPKTGLVASHEDPNDLAQSIFFMNVEDAAAAAEGYNSSGNGSEGAMDGMMSQMGDTIGIIVTVLVIAAGIAGGVFFIRRERE